jgi:diguanylate cyclase (GGDEF)-like protein
MARVAKHTGRAARRATRRGSEADDRDERTVLVVENSHAVAQMVSMYVAEHCGRSTQVVHTLAQAREALTSEDAAHWLAAVVNLELADAAGEDIVTLTLAAGLPTIVLTGTFSESMRQRILRHDIVDYCVKGKAGLEALVKVIDRLQRNPSRKIMVAADQPAARANQMRMLRAHRFLALESVDSEQALALQREHPDLSLVIVDLTGGKQAGLELVTQLRNTARADELAIIGLSEAESAGTSVRFLKAGASDFLPKPFEKEEYMCRVYASLEMVEAVRRIKQAAFVDGLTGAANRLAFFRQVPAQLEAALRERARPAVVLLSIDKLRRINEEHGHAAGDAVLRHTARVLGERLGKRGWIARFSGEQFCAFVRDVAPTGLAKLFEQICGAIERASLTFEGRKLGATLSCGIAVCEGDESLDALVNRADGALEDAEEAGGNRVVMQP